MANVRRNSPKREQIEPPSASSVTALVATDIAAWLIIGGIAHSSDEVQDSVPALLLVDVLVLAQFPVTCALVIAMECRQSGWGLQVFSVGMIGLGIASFYAIPQSSFSGYQALFTSLSGMYLGWLFEIVTGACAALTKCGTDPAPDIATRPSQPAVSSDEQRGHQSTGQAVFSPYKTVDAKVLGDSK